MKDDEKGIGWLVVDYGVDCCCSSWLIDEHLQVVDDVVTCKILGIGFLCENQSE